MTEISTISQYETICTATKVYCWHLCVLEANDESNKPDRGTVAKKMKKVKKEGEMEGAETMMEAAVDAKRGVKEIIEDIRRGCKVNYYNFMQIVVVPFFHGFKS